jgi:hypothetical protein
MTASSLLIGAGARRRIWFAGATFVVIDNLAHNFLHRTGNLCRFEADHAYGWLAANQNGAPTWSSVLPTTL